MNDRSRPSLRRCSLRLAGLALWFCAAALSLAACGQSSGVTLTAAARAGCAVETAAQTAFDQNCANNPTTSCQTMLPGRDCGYCHHSGGQALNSPWTVSGTVYASATSACDPGGVAGLVVQVLDPTMVDANGKAMPQPNGTLVTNSVGNFYSSATYTTPLRMRVFQQDPMYPLDYTHAIKTIEMMTPQGGLGGAAVDCATCHAEPPTTGAPGRVYFN